MKFTSEIAMTLTCEIAEFQNVPRKIFIQSRKTAINEGAKANETLAHLVVSEKNEDTKFKHKESNIKNCHFRKSFAIRKPRFLTPTHGLVAGPWTRQKTPDESADD